MADDKLNPETPEPGRLDPGAGAEIYAATAAEGGIDLSGLEAGPALEEAPPSEGPSREEIADEAAEETAEQAVRDDQTGAAAAQAESQRSAAREAQAVDMRRLRLPYVVAVYGFFATIFIWLWKQFKAIPPLDDIFDRIIFSLGMQRKFPSMLRRAGNLILQGRYAEAAKWYRDILALRPLTVEAYDGLGRAYFRMGRTEEANLEFTIAENLERILQNRDDLEAASALALAFLARHQIKLAISLVEPVLISHFYAPTNSELLKAMGSVYQELRSHRKLYQVYAAGLAQHPEDYEYYLLKGDAEQKIGNNAEGERLITWGNLLKRIKDNSTDADAFMTMSEICFRENRVDEALDFLYKTAKAVPGDAPLRLTLAETCFKENRVEEGLGFLNKAAAAAPGDAALRLTLAEICFKEHRVDEGLGFLSKAAAAAPGDAALRLTLAEICFKEHKNEEGLKFLIASAALTPENTDLRWRLFNLFMKQSDIDSALKYFLEIVALDPDNDDLQYRLADFYRKHKRRPEALPIYKAMAEKYPRDPKPHTLWGTLLLEMGQIEEGKRLQELAKLLNIGQKPNPDHVETMAFMKHLFSLGRHAEACEWLDRGLSQWPYHGELVMIKVKILYNEYQYKEAVTYLKRLISVRPDVAEPHIWIAMCYQRLGDNMAALAEAHLCTRLAPKSYVAHKVLGDVLKEQKKLSQANAAYEVAEMMRHQNAQNEEEASPAKSDKKSAKKSAKAR